VSTAVQPALRTGTWLRATGWLLLPIACVLFLLVVPTLDPVHNLVVVFFAVSAASLLRAPRGLAVARTWVVGYLVLQFPARTLFLLTAPKERPPLFAELSPGVGLEPALATALFQSCAGLAVMLLAYRLVPRPGKERARVVTAASLRRGSLVRILAVAALLLPVELSTASSSASGGGFIVSLPGLFASGAAAAVCYAVVQQPRRYFVTAVLALVYAGVRVSLLHSKLALLGCLVALLVGFAAREQERRGGRSMTVRGAAVLLATAVAALTVFAVSSGRTRGQDATGSVFQGGSAAVSRSYGVDALVASNAYLDAGHPQMHGQSFVDLATSWVPRSLWPDKPKSFSIRYGEEVFSFSHSVGSEFFAPSYSGEWLLNFGFIGLLAGWAIFGVILAKVDAVPSLAHRTLWLVPLVHLVEGSIVAQLWLALPFVLGGYAVLGRPVRATRRGRP
jgi:hypothetical protein